MTNTNWCERLHSVTHHPSIAQLFDFDFFLFYGVKYFELLINMCLLCLSLLLTLLISLHISSSFIIIFVGFLWWRQRPFAPPPVRRLKSAQKEEALQRGAGHHVALLPAVGAVRPGGRLLQPGDSLQTGTCPQPRLCGLSLSLFFWYYIFFNKWLIVGLGKY